MSAAFFEMVMKRRVARRVEDLDDGTVKVIARSSVSSEYSHLDDLVKDWTP